MSYRSEIEGAAAAYRIFDPDIVEAMVLQESGGDQWAYNPEPRYPYLWNVRLNGPYHVESAADLESKFPPSGFYDTRGFHGADADQEWWGQQASWGLMQIMGALARELGFKGIYLPGLCDVHTNLRFGCMHLASLIEWANGDVWQAVAAYNGGKGGWSDSGPQAYVTKVRQRRDAILGV